MAKAQDIQRITRSIQFLEAHEHRLQEELERTKAEREEKEAVLDNFYRAQLQITPC